jgi:FO synthase
MLRRLAMAAVNSNLDALLQDAARGARIEGADALRILPYAPLPPLMVTAESLTRAGFAERVTYSRKVFIPLTQLCRDVCHYCTFAHKPRELPAAYLASEQVLSIARAGEGAGCKEALFTLGDKPELRYQAARAQLAQAGVSTTIDYLADAARLVLEQTGLLPHLNPGVLSRADLERLRPLAASMGLMLESSAARLCQRGGPHFGSPDKLPERRLQTLRDAGELGIAMTTGLLIGIGESRRERIEALLLLRSLHEQHGHLQELIVQNFKPKPGTRMATAPEPPLAEQLWTIAVARLLFGAGMSIQAPPNLQPDALASLIGAGINDWGGVSPVTPDHVNPEAPWPQLGVLAERTAAAGRQLTQRLALVPEFALRAERWTDAAVATRIRRLIDSRGCARSDDWFAGSSTPLPAAAWHWIGEVGGRTSARTGRTSGGRSGGGRTGGGTTELSDTLAAAAQGEELAEDALARLFAADGDDLQAVLQAADELRARTVGAEVTYVVNRNINYTNICHYHCGFCAFSKGRTAASLRGPGYNLELDEIAQRVREAATAGATEVCLQGGIHPSFTGETYLSIVAAVKDAVPDMHVHAFSPLEIQHGAATLGLPLGDYLERLRAAGLSTLPGTAAEILDDEVRAVICPDKLRTDEWLTVIGTAHRIGLRTTATIMFGHVDQPRHWARHLLRVRRLQAQTRGITEFVPLPFVHMEAPLWRRGRARSGPTLREAVLMHAVARLALHPLVTNIQASWVKMSPEGVELCLNAGANDMGGTLMNESITRAAGGVHGQQLDGAQMQALARRVGRPVRQRTTLYGVPPMTLLAPRQPRAQCPLPQPVSRTDATPRLQSLS